MRRFVFILTLLQFSLGQAAQIQVNTKGMVCGFCAQGIKKKFSSEEAVQSVDVSLEKQLVTLNIKSSQDLSDERIAELIREAGFKPGKIKR